MMKYILIATSLLLFSCDDMSPKMFDNNKLNYQKDKGFEDQWVLVTPPTDTLLFHSFEIKNNQIFIHDLSKNGEKEKTLDPINYTKISETEITSKYKGWTLDMSSTDEHYVLILYQSKGEEKDNHIYWRKSEYEKNP